MHYISTKIVDHKIFKNFPNIFDDVFQIWLKKKLEKMFGLNVYLLKPQS